MHIFPAALILICTGAIAPFQTRFEVNLTTAVIDATYTDGAGETKILYDKLNREGFCYKRNDIKFCNTPLSDEATVDFKFIDASGAIRTGGGKLMCHPGNMGG